MVWGCSVPFLDSWETGSGKYVGCMTNKSYNDQSGHSATLVGAWSYFIGQVVLKLLISLQSWQIWGYMSDMHPLLYEHIN